MNTATLVLAVLLLGGCYAKPEQCTPRGEPCDRQGLCCGALRCEEGACGGPPACGDGTCASSETDTCCQDCGCALGSTCTAQGWCLSTERCGDGRCGIGESSATCCQDCGCPTGQSCSGGVCRAAAACGDGRCDPGESSANCCKDCGCGALLQCTVAGCVAPRQSTLRWTVTNQCYNGDTIQVRFFDFQASLVWPSTTQAYISTAGTSFTQALNCNTGDQICLGATQPVRGYFWGVGVNGTFTCTSCCFTCADQSVNIGALTCP